MAIFKLFPSKTATVYSYYPTKNTGLDEITDLSLYNSIEGTPEVSRTLIQFDNTEINQLISSQPLISGSNYKTYLKLYLANASEIPLEYTIYCHAISGSWDMGTGRLANSPEVTDGVSWLNRTSTKIWTTSSFTSYTSSGHTGIGTGSFSSGSEGGVTWWNSLKPSGSSTTYSMVTSQSFTHSDSKDIEIDITDQFTAWKSSWFNNDGLLLKHSSSLEFSTSSYFETKYFTSNTHTIYPPCLEVRWNDFNYNSGSLSTITNSNIVVSIGNNKNEYQQDSVQRFRINVRDKNPIRTFQTSSIYLNNKLLPTSSYWSIKDYNTEEIIIDYDTIYTKLSADSNGNYFDVYMNGLEPERYFKILIKTIISGEITVIDNNNIFKVVR